MARRSTATASADATHAFEPRCIVLVVRAKSQNNNRCSTESISIEANKNINRTDAAKKLFKIVANVVEKAGTDDVSLLKALVGDVGGRHFQTVNPSLDSSSVLASQLQNVLAMLHQPQHTFMAKSCIEAVKQARKQMKTTPNEVRLVFGFVTTAIGDGIILFVDINFGQNGTDMHIRSAPVGQQSPILSQWSRAA